MALANNRISLTGFDDLSKFEMADVQNIIERAYEKLATQVSIELKVRAKTYHETGSREKTSLTLDAHAEDGTHFKATADAWDLHEALREGFEKLEWQVRKHVETQ